MGRIIGIVVAGIEDRHRIPVAIEAQEGKREVHGTLRVARKLREALHERAVGGVLLGPFGKCALARDGDGVFGLGVRPDGNLAARRVVGGTAKGNGNALAGPVPAVL